jgi:hypothetical protein
MISQVQYYKDHGIPIDGVGFRSHFVSGEVPSLANLTTNYERLTTLGVEIAITALDIRTSATPSGASILQQKTDYKTVISACKAVAGCVGVTLSDISDKVRSKKFFFNHKYNTGLVFSTPPSPVFFLHWILGVELTLAAQGAGFGRALPWDTVRGRLHTPTFLTSLRIFC